MSVTLTQEPSGAASAQQCSTCLDVHELAGVVSLLNGGLAKVLGKPRQSDVVAGEERAHRVVDIADIVLRKRTPRRTRRHGAALSALASKEKVKASSRPKTRPHETQGTVERLHIAHLDVNLSIGVAQA